VIAELVAIEPVSVFPVGLLRLRSTRLCVLSPNVGSLPLNWGILY
jgi:hypothetical protein